MQLGLPLVDRSALADLYFVRNRRAKRYVMRVDLDGRVRVTIPRGGSRGEAAVFADRHIDWATRQRAHTVPTPVDTEEQAALRSQAERDLPARLLALAAVHGLSVTRVSIRNQRSRWGSCGRDGHVSLNWRLVLMPDWVRDYVLLHELMHLLHMDHSKEYWRLVAAACPDYEAARRWLRAHGRSLR